MGDRFRWVHVGVVAALAATVATGIGVINRVGATTGTGSVFVPITPCRLMDTRPAPDNVGSRALPLITNDIYSVQAAGASTGRCNIPAGATAVTMNVTIIRPKAASFLTVWPSDQTRPLAASLTWVAGQAPTPNAVTSGLSPAGFVSFYNLAGDVDLAVDVVGYYQPGAAGAQGPPGPKGDTGQKGDTGSPGPRPAQVVWVAKSGGDFTTVSAALAAITDNNASHPYVIKIAPGTYTESGTLTMKDHVDLEGSGQSSTELTCTCGSTSDPVVFNANPTLAAIGQLTAEVRNLTISTTGFSVYDTAVLTSDATTTLAFRNVQVNASGASQTFGVLNKLSSPTLDHVTTRSTSVGANAYGVYILGSNLADTPVISDLSTTASGGSNNYGIYVNGDAQVSVTRSTITGTGSTSYGIYITNPLFPAVVRDSTVTGTTASVASDIAAATYVVNTRLNGPTQGANVTCRNSYGSSYAVLAANCT